MSYVAQSELADESKMMSALQEGRNILLTEFFVETTDFHGVTTIGRTPSVWRDFFQQTHAQKAKGYNTRSSHYTAEFMGYRYRCCLANSQKGWCISMRHLPSKIPALRDDLGLDWNLIRPLTEGSGLTPS